MERRAGILVLGTVLAGLLLASCVQMHSPPPWSYGTEEQEEDIDTLGGVVFTLGGRIPARGELVGHPSGIEFEVLDADPRRIKRLRIHLPKEREGTTGKSSATRSAS